MLAIIWENNLASYYQPKYKLLEVIFYTNSKYAWNLKDKKFFTGYWFFFSKNNHYIV